MRPVRIHRSSIYVRVDVKKSVFNYLYIHVRDSKMLPKKKFFKDAETCDKSRAETCKLKKLELNRRATQAARMVVEDV